MSYAKERRMKTALIGSLVIRLRRLTEVPDGIFYAKALIRVRGQMRRVLVVRS